MSESGTSSSSKAANAQIAHEKRKQSFSDDDDGGNNATNCRAKTTTGTAISVASVSLEQLAFTSDHQVLKNHDADWNDGGNVYAKPDWTVAGVSNPVSHTGAASVTLTLTVRIDPAGASQTRISIVGKIGGRTHFRYNDRAGGGVHSITIMSLQPLPAEVQQFAYDVNWRLDCGVHSQAATTRNVVYVTLGIPTTPPACTGITLKRMRTAVAVVAATGTILPHTIVGTIIGQFANYNLAVALDNAWTLSDALAHGADCQTIVRYTDQIIKMVGCGGTATFVVVYAVPGNPTIPIVTRDAYRPNISDPPNWRTADLNSPYVNQDATLVDLSGGQNRYEACLEFTDAGQTLFYAGGVGRKDTTLEVIQAFFAMCWRDNNLPNTPITAICHRYRPAAANDGVIAALPANLRAGAQA
jgi:hypothetical protein